MAGFVERVLIEVQARTQGAVADIKAVGKATNEAEGAFGKAKTASVGLASTIQSMISPQAVAGIGAAAIAAGVKLADGFTTAALAADDMANRTGLATEEASRWIAVADDVGISAESISGAAQKLVTNLGKAPDKFRALGITAHDTNGQLLQAIELLNDTPAGAQRAALGAELFGKSWGNVAELVEQGSDQITKSLGEVSDAQVFDAEEVTKAKRYRAAMDELGDSISDLGVEVGETLVPALADMASTLAEIVKLGPKIGSIPGLDKLGWAVSQFTGPIVDSVENMGRALDTDRGFLDRFTGGLADVTAVIPGLGKATDALADMTNADNDATEAQNEGIAASVDYAVALSGMSDEALKGVQPAEDLEKATDDAAKAYERATKAAQDAAEAVRENAQAEFEANRTAADIIREKLGAQDEINKAIAEANAAGGKNNELNEKAADLLIKNADNTRDLAVETAKANGLTLDAASAQEAWNKDLLTSAKTLDGPQRDAILRYIGTVNGIPAEKITEILADSDPNNIAQVSAEIDRAAKARTATINVQARWDSDILAFFAAGGNANDLILGGRSVSTTNVTVNVPPTLSPDRVLQAVGAGERRSGGLRRG